MGVFLRLNSHANYSILLPFIPDKPVCKTHQSLCAVPEDFFPKTVIREPVLWKCSSYEAAKGSATIVWFITEYEQVLADIYL